jgi:RHS repeat-associated protein
VADEWLWAFGDGMTSTLASPVYTYTQAGVYTVTQWVTDTATGEADVLTRTDFITVAEGTGDLMTTTIAYDYDPLYRLITATYSSGEVYTYTYDAVGNRLAMGAEGELITYTYDAGDSWSPAYRLTWVDDVEYTWDDGDQRSHGNLLSNGVFSYTYDADGSRPSGANRLIEVVSGTLTTAFTYNGNGARMAKVVDGTIISYVLDVNTPLPVVLMEQQGAQGTVHYLYGLDLLGQQQPAQDWLYYYGDGLGSTRQLTDGQGQVVTSLAYAPFGALRDVSGPLARFLFTGEQHDPSTGLYYLRARYYDPATGRFLTRDPFPGFAFDPVSQHPYVYARNNPVNLVDPSGLQGRLPEWFRELVELYVKLVSGVIPEAEGIGIGAGVGTLVSIAEDIFEKQVAAARPTELVPLPPRLLQTSSLSRASGRVAAGLFSALFQVAHDLDLCLTPLQRLGRAGIAGLEGVVISAAVGVAFATLGVVGAPAVIGAIVVGASAGIIMDQLINPRLVFPAIGLTPP